MPRLPILPLAVVLVSGLALAGCGEKSDTASTAATTKAGDTKSAAAKTTEAPKTDKPAAPPKPSSGE